MSSLHQIVQIIIALLAVSILVVFLAYIVVCASGNKSEIDTILMLEEQQLHEDVERYIDIKGVQTKIKTADGSMFTSSFLTEFIEYINMSNKLLNNQ